MWWDDVYWVQGNSKKSDIIKISFLRSLEIVRKTQHNHTQRNQQNNKIKATVSKMTQSLITIKADCCYAELLLVLGVTILKLCWWSLCYAKCHYAKCHYAECRYAECHYAECRYAGYCNFAIAMLNVAVMSVIMLSTAFFQYSERRSTLIGYSLACKYYTGWKCNHSSLFCYGNNGTEHLCVILT